MPTPTNTPTKQIQTATNVDFDDFRTRFNNLLNDLGLVLFERREEIHGIGLAALGKLNMFHLGAPGLAKSQLPRHFVARIDGLDEGAFFDVQVNRTTVPEEFFGPVSVTGLKEDRYVRNPRHRLPEAVVALLDEFFKGSSVILNTGLKALEERKWDNDGQSMPLPLWFAIAPSNECPTDAEFAAIRDRLPLSYVSENIKQDESFRKMIRMAVARHKSPTPEKFVTAGEIQAAQLDVLNVALDEAMLDAMVEVRRLLKDEGIVPSDRRFVKATEVLRAHAWLAGRMQVKIDDFRILKHVLWLDPEQRRTVERCVLELANPIDKEANEHLEDIEDLSAQFAKTDRDCSTNEERIRNGLEYHAKLKPIATKLDELNKIASQKSYDSDVLEEAQHQLKVLNDKLKATFAMPGIDDDD